jgi:hypothetical protein
MADRTRYSILQQLRQGLTGHAGWAAAWRTKPLKQRYDAVIIGGGRGPERPQPAAASRRSATIF